MKKKLSLCAAASFVCYLLIPFLSVRFAGMAGMAICLILFFAADPLVCLLVGIMAGSDPRRLWWLPAAAAAVMPLCFWLCVWEFIPELYIYSGFYLLIGWAAMGISALTNRRSKSQ